MDYRRGNAVTHKEVFLKPCIDNLLDQLGEEKVLFMLDAKSGY